MHAAVTRTACAKIILCGEHAVVYHRPAIALPLPFLRATATVAHASGRSHIDAPDIHRRFDIAERLDHPLARIVSLTVELARARGMAVDGDGTTGLRLEIRSDIPVTSHLGSGAAVSVACARAIAAHFGHELAPADASGLAFEVEKIYHGTPSGIDNTVIAYEKPVWFVRGVEPVVLEAGEHTPGSWGDLHLVIGDTGIATPTRVPVGEVRRHWEADPARFEALFDEIAAVVVDAREALRLGDVEHLGVLLDRNHDLLQRVGVSCPELDALCAAARDAGALGAKLSGAGQGGNMIALTRGPTHADEVRRALLAAGASRVI